MRVHRFSRQAGFTLIETMISIAIMSILLAIAVPSFAESRLASQLRSSSSSLLASANLARSEAIKRNKPVQLCVSADGKECGGGGWEQGWIVTLGKERVLQTQAAASNGFRIVEAAGVTAITFDPTGIGATPASLKICRSTPNPGVQERVVTIDAAGRASTRRTTTGTC